MPMHAFTPSEEVWEEDINVAVRNGAGGTRYRSDSTSVVRRFENDLRANEEPQYVVVMEGHEPGLKVRLIPAWGKAPGLSRKRIKG
jgi:hypothetical protein